MAYCHGPTSPYGCGHHREHSIAARKAWRTRRRSRAFLGTSEAEALRTQVGDFEGHHTHQTKSGAVKHLLKINGYWFSMGQSEYRGLVSAGKAQLRSKKREERHQQRAAVLDAIRAPKRAERERRRAEREQQEQEKIARRVQREEHSEVLAVIRRNGGVKRHTSKDSHGREYMRSEYDLIPAHARAKKARGVERERGVTMDQAAELVNEHMPWLNVHTGDDLTRYFQRVGEVRTARAERRKRAAAPAPAARRPRQKHPAVPAPIPEPAPSASWGDVFGEAQPIPHPTTGGPGDLFGGDTEQTGKEANHRRHTHLWEPWRSDWRYMRCKKCGALEHSTFGSGVSL